MLRRAIVLAAGLGERFGGSEHKLLARISGYRLIEYPIRSIAATGTSRFLVVTNSVLLRRLSPLATELERELGLEVEFAVNDDARKGNARSLLLGLARAREPETLVTVADHVYPSTLVSGLVRKHRGDPLVVGGDRKPTHADVGEATLVKVDRDGVIERIGKGLDRWDYVDTGLHVVSASLSSYAELCGSEGELSALYECFSRSTRGGVVADLTGDLWKDVDTWEDYLRLVEGRDRVVALRAIESWRR